MRPGQAIARAPLWAAIAWAFCAAGMLWLYHGAFPSLAFRDPDDAMRLVQVRDWLNGHAFWDISQHRVNPPHGGPMHWSRIVDIPIAGLILMLRPIFGAAVAEMLACVIVPLLLLGGLVAATFVAARRIGGDRLALLCVAMLVTSPSILIQFTPLRIDHHGWQIMLASVALCGLVDPRPLRGGVVAGLALALWLQISSEALPYAALFCAIFAIRQWITREEAPRFAGFAIVLGSVALPLLMALRGPGAILARQCDALSYVYVWPLVVLTIVTAIALRLLGTETTTRRLGVMAAGGGAAFATFLLTGGPCLSGDPFAALGPVAYRIWYLQVMEGRPIWDQSLALMGMIVLTPLVGMIGTGLAVLRSDGAGRTLWVTLFCVLAGAVGVSLMVMRALSVAHVFALPGIALLVTLLFHRIQSQRVAIVRVLGSVSLVLLTPAGLCAGWMVLTEHSEEEGSHANRTICSDIRNLDAIGRLPPATLFAPIDMGPGILVQTRHRVIGTGHHRNATGITAVIEGFVDTPDQSRAVIARTSAAYVVICDDLNEMGVYKHENPQGLAAQLLKGRIPGWLEPIPAPAPLRIYRVR